MKASEIRKMSAEQLDAKLLELKDELFKLRFQQAINQLENPMRISAVKKDIEGFFFFLVAISLPLKLC